MGRIGIRFAICAALAAASGLAAAPAAGTHEGTARGKLVVKGKALTFERAWLVRGPDTGDDTKPAAYLILSSEDLSPAIAACKEIRCAVFDVVKEGAILEPLDVDDGHGSFWLRVLSSQLAKEQQISGRTWTPAVDRRDRLSGKLHFSYSNTGDEADLDIDAPLVKEFTVRRAPAAARAGAEFATHAGQQEETP